MKAKPDTADLGYNSITLPQLSSTADDGVSVEVSLGSEDTHGSPVTLEMAEAIGPSVSLQKAVTRNSDGAKSPLQRQQQPPGPRPSSSRGRCRTNTGGSHDSSACKTKEPTPVGLSLWFPRQTSTKQQGVCVPAISSIFSAIVLACTRALRSTAMMAVCFIDRS